MSKKQFNSKVIRMGSDRLMIHVPKLEHDDFRPGDKVKVVRHD